MTQIDKESIPDSDSGVHSNANKMGKLGLNGSVSEEDSGVGSEGKESDIADQTDTSSHVDTDSLKPVSDLAKKLARVEVIFSEASKGLHAARFWYEPKIAPEAKECEKNCTNSGTNSTETQ